jgi:hypothetical protein
MSSSFSPTMREGMLRERGVGEVDDVDVEVNGVAVGPGSEELESLTRRSLRILVDLDGC